jgi:hypothetical protein
LNTPNNVSPHNAAAELFKRLPKGIMHHDGLAQSCVAICEDIRIEKLISIAFPGARKWMSRGYKELWQMGFFGDVTEENFDEHLYHDRLNIKMKLQKSGFNYNFVNEREIEIETQSYNANTFDEAMLAAVELYKYVIEENETRNKDLPPESEEEGDGEGDDSGSNGKKKNSKKNQKNKSNEGDGDPSDGDGDSEDGDGESGDGDPSDGDGDASADDDGEGETGKGDGSSDGEDFDPDASADDELEDEDDSNRTEAKPSNGVGRTTGYTKNLSSKTESTFQEMMTGKSKSSNTTDVKDAAKQTSIMNSVSVSNNFVPYSSIAKQFKNAGF